MMTKPPYYYRQSWGIGTNLQLHSLHQAWRLFQELKSKKESLREGRIRERCVIIVDLLGLSLSQLLGQSYTSASARIPPPGKLLESFLCRNDLVNEKKNKIIERFTSFIGFYNDCRHFGASKHVKIDKLTFDIVKDFFSLTIEIWDIICNYAKSKYESILEFDTIKNILEYNEDDEDEDKW